eukprot:Gb_31357 [translate_table: standard]
MKAWHTTRIPSGNPIQRHCIITSRKKEETRALKKKRRRMTTFITMDAGTEEHVNNATINPILSKEETSSEGGLGRFYSSKRGVKDVVDSGIDNVPPIFVQPPHLRSQSADYNDNDNDSDNDAQIIPVVDLEGFDDLLRRPQILQHIVDACQTVGIFRVVNHGVPIDVMRSMIEAVHTFHQQPPEEKMKYETEDLSAPVKYAPTFNFRNEPAAQWTDILRIVYPPDLKELPICCGETVIEYGKQIRDLAAKLFTLLAECLSLPPDYLTETINCLSRQIFTLSYFPPCPQPHLTFGLTSHSDYACMTILLQDNVQGLQIFNEGKWVKVSPVPGTFLVNLGDTFEIMSNGRFKSVEHRVLTNAENARVSVPTFFSLSAKDKVEPIPILLGDHNPPLYKEILCKDFVELYTKHVSGGKTDIRDSGRRTMAGDPVTTKPTVLKDDEEVFVNGLDFIISKQLIAEVSGLLREGQKGFVADPTRGGFPRLSGAHVPKAQLLLGPALASLTLKIGEKTTDKAKIVDFVESTKEKFDDSDVGKSTEAGCSTKEVGTGTPDKGSMKGLDGTHNLMEELEYHLKVL